MTHDNMKNLICAFCDFPITIDISISTSLPTWHIYTITNLLNNKSTECKMPQNFDYRGWYHNQPLYTYNPWEDFVQKFVSVNLGQII